jgi:hypothetical protein
MFRYIVCIIFLLLINYNSVAVVRQISGQQTEGHIDHANTQMFGLLAWLPLDGGVDVKSPEWGIKDISNFGYLKEHDSTNSSVSIWQPGRRGMAYYAPNLNEVIRLSFAGNPIIYDRQVMSFTSWYKSDNPNTGIQILWIQQGTTFNYLILGEWSAGLSNELVSVLTYTGAPVNTLYYADGAAVRLGFFNYRWHHVAFTVNDKEYQVYIDGKLVPLAVDAGANDGSWGPISASIVHLNSAGNLVGFQSDARIYDRVLTRQEINSIIVNGREPQEFDLLNSFDGILGQVISIMVD